MWYYIFLQVVLHFWLLECNSGTFGATILLIGESNETQLVRLFEESVSSGFQVKTHYIDHDQEEINHNQTVCSIMSTQSYAIMVDLTWGGWEAAQQLASETGMPYIRVEASNAPFVQAADDFLHQREAMDAALIFETEVELDQSLYYIIGNYELRVLVISLDELDRDPYDRLKNLRPVPTAFVAFGTAQTLSGILDKASKKTLMKRDSRWNFFVEDFAAPDFNTGGAEVDIVVASMSSATCCALNGEPGSSGSCTCSPGTKPKQIIARQASKLITTAAISMTNQNYRCGSKASTLPRDEFLVNLKSGAEISSYNVDGDKLYHPIALDFKLVSKRMNKTVQLATWNPNDKVTFAPNFTNQPLPRFFRVGMNPSAPWMFFKTDKKTGQRLLDGKGNYIFDGYCVKLLKEMAKRLQFEYEIVLSSDYEKSGYEYGRKLADGTWSGLIGDLSSGDIDIVVADLTMTSEREEIIDYVSPYFDQAGISIVLRNKLREQSLFKFLHVLKPEVWLGILAAVILTALLIWFLDRFSPYSARNNKAAYPGPCREFTLKESFWFALTSLTPQGGGEAPKALSGRVLVAAYWLFVVLMLATFTANLAAFLTVERMQTTIQSLEELARQSRINYTVVKDTAYMEYFVNMASAEEELYQKWKELTLNGSDNPAKYRVWDYPIREQYTHVLQVLKDTGPVESSDAGFKKVLSHTDGDFALIHDAARIRYEVYNDCDLLEIGEPFAEQPYALAVQQGSHLQEMLSKTILELQKDRYFETLQGQFWNSSKKNNCPVLDDSEGITLQSLGGVFIATLVGLTIAMITLVVEVFMQKKRERLNMVTDVSPMTQEKIKAMQAFEGSSGGLGGGTIKPYNISSTMPTINN